MTSGVAETNRGAGTKRRLPQEGKVDAFETGIVEMLAAVRLDDSHAVNDDRSTHNVRQSEDVRLQIVFG